VPSPSGPEPYAATAGGPIRPPGGGTQEDASALLDGDDADAERPRDSDGVRPQMPALVTARRGRLHPS
jgi:hypothetical protein